MPDFIWDRGWWSFWVLNWWAWAILIAPIAYGVKCLDDWLWNKHIKLRLWISRNVGV